MTSFFRHAIHIIAERRAAARMLRLQRIFIQPLANFTRKILAIKFRHSFQDRFKQNTLRTRIIKRLQNAQQLYVIFAQNGTIGYAIIAVTCKAVKLMNKNNLEKFFRARNCQNTWNNGTPYK